MRVLAAQAPGWAAQVAIVVAKDARLEWRSKARISTTLVFGLLVLLLFSFAVGPQPLMLRRLAPGLLWLAILLSSILGLAESMRQESDQAALGGLRLLAISGSALYMGKALGNMLAQLALAAVLLPVCIALYDVEIQGRYRSLLGVLLLGIGGISAPGTLYAAMTAQTRARDVLLPVLLFPILVPGLLAAVRATSGIMHGDPMGELGSWILLLLVFNLVYWTLCPMLFDKVLES